MKSNRTKWVVATVLVSLVLAACGTVAGGLVGSGIGRAVGDQRAGALIGAGIGLFYDLAD